MSSNDFESCHNDDFGSQSSEESFTSVASTVEVTTNMWDNDRKYLPSTSSGSKDHKSVYKKLSLFQEVLIELKDKQRCLFGAEGEDWRPKSSGITTVKSSCYCWKKLIFTCPNCIERKSYWTWPSESYYSSSFVKRNRYLGYSSVNSSSSWKWNYHESFSSVVSNQSRPMYLRKNSSCHSSFDENFSGVLKHPVVDFLKPTPQIHFKTESMKHRNYQHKHRLVMEEQERKVEAERWKERTARSTSELATLPSKHPLVQNPSTVTTRAIMEGARNISSIRRETLVKAIWFSKGDSPSLNGVLSSGGDVRQRHIGEQTEEDEKPPKLVVNLNHSDKASQVPEPLPTPEPEIEVKEEDETDGLVEQENGCLLDCVALTLQCCDCSIILMLDLRKRHIMAETIMVTSKSQLAILPLEYPLEKYSSTESTNVMMENAMNIGSGESPSVKDVLPSGENITPDEQADEDQKPAKLVVNLNRADKATQVPETLQTTEPVIELKRNDEKDCFEEPDSDCLLDCVGLTLKCCECSIM